MQSHQMWTLIESEMQLHRKAPTDHRWALREHGDSSAHLRSSRDRRCCRGAVTQSGGPGKDGLQALYQLGLVSLSGALKSTTKS